MGKFTLTGRKILRRVPRWKKRSKTYSPRKRRRRKKRKRARNRKLTRRRSPTRKRSTLKPARIVRPPLREVAGEQSASHSTGGISSDRIFPGGFVGVSALVAAGCQRLCNQEREDLHIGRAGH